MFKRNRQKNQEESAFIYGFLKVWMRAFFVHGFRGMNGFLSVFHGEFRSIRVIRVQKLIPSSDNEKAIAFICVQVWMRAFFILRV